MASTEQLQDRISRATLRLARLQARDLLARQRQRTKERRQERREECRRRRELAEAVLVSGADRMTNHELIHVLSEHMQQRRPTHSTEHVSQERSAP